MSAPSIGAPRYIKQVLTDLKGEMDLNTAAGDDSAIKDAPAAAADTALSCNWEIAGHCYFQLWTDIPMESQSTGGSNNSTGQED